MKNLIIIGGGGMGRSVYCIAQGCKGFATEFTIKGFIDDDLHSLDGFEGYPPVLDTIHNYEIQSDDVFICSIGNVKTKKRLSEELKQKGAKFLTLIHETAIVRQNAIIGEGTIVADYASIGADCKIGQGCLIQSYSIVAHDCIIGDYVRVDTHAVCVGGVILKDLATIHTGTVISHKVIVEEGSTVAATSFVIKKVKAGSTVWGNPAKILN